MDNKGVSLVELSIAITVALLTFAILFYVTFTLQTNVNIASGLLGMSEKGRLAVNYISQDIREAKAVRSSYGSYSTGGDTLILDVPSIDGSGNIIDPDTKFDVIIYTLDSADPKKLIRVVYADGASSRTSGTETIIEDVDSLSFSGTTSETIGIQITTSTATADAERQSTITTSASLRNM